MRHQQLFRRVAHGGRIIHHQGRGVNMLQNMRGRDIGHVEGRILAHQHHVHRRQFHTLGRLGVEMRAALTLHRYLAGQGGDPVGNAAGRPIDGLAFPQREVAHFVVPQRVATGLGFQHQGERTVTVDIDRLQRVHLNRNL